MGSLEQVLGVLHSTMPAGGLHQVGALPSAIHCSGYCSQRTLPCVFSASSAQLVSSQSLSGHWHVSEEQGTPPAALRRGNA